MDKWESQLKHQHRVYCREVVLWRGIPARELKPPAAYRLGRL
jgi:hypothetical protein